jgi:hypothetical protein
VNHDELLKRDWGEGWETLPEAPPLVPREGVVVGFSGTGRRPLTTPQRAALGVVLDDLAPTEAHHGGCVHADAEFHVLCMARGLRVVVHRGDTPDRWDDCLGAAEYLDPKPNLDRNVDVVRASDAMVFCPHGRLELQRSGTWYTVRRARLYGVPHVIVYPDGEAVREG